MDDVIRTSVSRWYQSHREEIVRRLMDFVSIPSVARYDEPGHPYGLECHRMMDAFRQAAEQMDLATECFGDHVVTASLGEDPGRKTIGVWTHLDVVPPGNGWTFPPFEPVCVDGLVIGRGADDNKSAATGALYMLRCLKELEIPLHCNLKVLAGCDEECGSRGVAYFARHYPCPDFSLVPDCPFPVCHGEKGIIDVTFRSVRPLSDDFLSMAGGVASNVIPDTATAALRLTENRLRRLDSLPEGVSARAEADRILFTARGTSGHAGFPVGHVNAVQALIRALLDARMVGAEDKAILQFLDDVNGDCYGTALGIAMEDAVSGPLTCAGTVLSLEDGRPCLTANIRYCVTADGAAIHSALAGAAGRGAFELARFSDSAPNYFPKDHPIVTALTDVYNRMTGNRAEPYVMSGGTYARKLPNAVGFGIGGRPLPPCDRIPRGHGGAHLPDEALCLEHYFQALEIFTMGVIEADRCLSAQD